MNIRNLDVHRPGCRRSLRPHEALALAEVGNGLGVGHLVFQATQGLQRRGDLDLLAQQPGHHRVARARVGAELDLDPLIVLARWGAALSVTFDASVS